MGSDSRELRFGVHVEVDFSALLGVSNFTKERVKQAQQRSNVWKDADDSGPSFELLIHSVDHIAGAHFAPVLRGQVKNGPGRSSTAPR